MNPAILHWKQMDWNCHELFVDDDDTSLAKIKADHDNIQLKGGLRYVACSGQHTDIKGLRSYHKSLREAQMACLRHVLEHFQGISTIDRSVKGRWRHIQDYYEYSSNERVLGKVQVYRNADYLCITYAKYGDMLLKICETIDIALAKQALEKYWGGELEEIYASAKTNATTSTLS